MARAADEVRLGIDFILKSQIIVDGKRTGWCAQHGMTDYEPKGAREYEHPSISGSEGTGVVAFLMAQEQTPEIEEAVKGALAWFRSPDTILEDYAYDDDVFVPRDGSRVWYRFYDIPSNEPIFSSYDTVIYLGLDNQDKKKIGYRWGGTWPEALLSYADSVGY